jgi:hypothetical protein
MDLPMSKVFLRIYFALGSAYFALGGVCFLQWHVLADENSDRQCCQGAEIPSTKFLEFLAKISTGITIIWFT